MCYLLWVTLTPGFYLLPVALGQAGDRTFHMVTQTEGAPPIPPPPPTHTHCFSAATISSSECLWALLWAFSAQERSAEHRLPLTHRAL